MMAVIGQGSSVRMEYPTHTTRAVPMSPINHRLPAWLLVPALLLLTPPPAGSSPHAGRDLERNLGLSGWLGLFRQDGADPLRPRRR